jgi:hypothetical protein
MRMSALGSQLSALRKGFLGQLSGQASHKSVKRFTRRRGAAERDA